MKLHQDITGKGSRVALPRVHKIFVNRSSDIGVMVTKSVSMERINIKLYLERHFECIW